MDHFLASVLQDDDELELVADAPHPDSADEDPGPHRKSDGHGTMLHTQTISNHCIQCIQCILF